MRDRTSGAPLLCIEDFTASEVAEGIGEFCITTTIKK